MSWDLLGIIVVNVGVGILGAAMQRIAGLGRRAFIGYYLVLAPVGLQAWDEPLMWLTFAFATAGLIVITISCRRARGF